MRTIGHRAQRTLANPAQVEGVGLITSSRVCVRFLPAPAYTGILFRRTDLASRPEYPALADRVTDTQRRTTLGPASEGLTLIEHVMSALAGLRIDNAIVEVDGPEPPGLDGSARGFVRALLEAKIVVQSALRPIYTPSQPIAVAASGATITLHPATDPTFTATYFLDYGPHAPVPRHWYTTNVRPDLFVNEVADCRTFLREAEAVGLRAMGIGKHVTAADLVVFDARGVKDNTLRFADEPARHKVLDMIGDLALCGFDLAGHVVAYRSGHALNVELARRLLQASSTERLATSRGALLRRAA